MPSRLLIFRRRDTAGATRPSGERSLRTVKLFSVVARLLSVFTFLCVLAPFYRALSSPGCLLVLLVCLTKQSNVGPESPNTCREAKACFDIDRIRPDFDQLWLDIDQARPKLTWPEFDHIRRDFGLIWATRGGGTRKVLEC